MAIDTVRIKDLEEVSVNDLANLWMVVDSGTPDSTNKVKLSALAGYIGGQADGRYIPLAGSSEITGSLLPKADKAIALGSGSFRWSALYSGEVHASDVLAIPTAAPSDPLPGEVYLYSGTGEYSVTPGGGGGGGSATIYDLIYQKNGTTISTINLGTAQGTINVTISRSDVEDTTHKLVTTDQIAAWSAKQDAISDLATIRSNASHGNTAYGWGDHSQAGYLTSYTETDPVFSASAASGITSGNITSWNGKYTKPSTGIPKTDLASAVQTSLGLADTALQSVAFSDLTSHPTTIAGYGITDAKIETPSGTSNRKITLGSNNFTIYSWALASAKPTYTLDEVADGTTRKLSDYALATSIPTKLSDLTDDVVSGNYLPLSAGSGNKLTGDLYFDGSATRDIKWTYGSTTASALRMTSDGGVRIGVNQIANSKTTILYGNYITLTAGTSSSTYELIYESAALRPGVNNNTKLGTSARKWSAVYATTLYGNLDWSYLTSTPTTLSGYGITDAIKNGEYYMPTNSFGSSYKGIQINSLNDGFYALDARTNMTITLTGFNTTSASNLFDANYESHVNITGGNTGVILMECSSNFSTYTYGYLYVSFYSNYAPASVSIRAYGTKSGTVGWYDYGAAADIISDSNSCFRAYNGNIYNIQKWEITIVAQSDVDCWVTQVEHQWTRGSQAMMSAVTKFAIKQDLYGEVEAPKFTVRGGTSSQFLKADGSLDSNTYALSSALGSYLPLSGGTLTGNLGLSTANGAININHIDSSSTSRSVLNITNASAVTLSASDSTWLSLYGNLINLRTLGTTNKNIYFNSNGYFYGEDNTVTLGSSSNSFAAVYSYYNYVTTGIYPAANLGAVIGSSSKRFGNAYIGQSLYLDDSTTVCGMYRGTSKQLFRALATYLRFGEGYAVSGSYTDFYGDTIRFYYGTAKTTAAISFQINNDATIYSKDFLPYTAAGFSLGASNRKWKDAYFGGTVYCDGALTIPTSAPSSPDSSKVYLWCDSTGNYAE